MHVFECNSMQACSWQRSSQTCSCRTQFTGCCPGIVTKLLHAAIAFMLLCWCGVQVPRVALTEMGPQLDCVLRRTRLPPVDLEKEALKQPKLTKKKVRRLERLSFIFEALGPRGRGSCRACECSARLLLALAALGLAHLPFLHANACGRLELL